jgi:alpha-L-fucosidase
MRYAVLTSKHHEGFCLWDSEHTDFKSTNTPARRDLVAEFVDAFRSEGLRVGLYHSLIDWHHPDFPIDGLHPRWTSEEEVARSERDGSAYVDYLHAQTAELVERFRPDIMWFDFSYGGGHVARGKGAEFWRSSDLEATVRRLQPEILINDRLDLPGSADFVTPEEVQPDALLTGTLWEACRTLNGSWGYAPGFQDWMDAGQVIRLLLDCTASGGNLLLNVGPDGRGAMEPRAALLLDQVGGWLDLHHEAVFGARASAVPPPQDCRITQCGDRVFVHVVGGWPTAHLVLPRLPVPPSFARFLHDGSEVPVELVPDREVWSHAVPIGPPGATVLRLPRRRPEVEVPVIELDVG